MKYKSEQEVKEEIVKMNAEAISKAESLVWEEIGDEAADKDDIKSAVMESMQVFVDFAEKAMDLIDDNFPDERSEEMRGMMGGLVHLEGRCQRVLDNWHKGDKYFEGITRSISSPSVVQDYSIEGSRLDVMSEYIKQNGMGENLLPIGEISPVLSAVIQHELREAEEAGDLSENVLGSMRKVAYEITEHTALSFESIQAIAENKESFPYIYEAVSSHDSSLNGSIEDVYHNITEGMHFAEREEKIDALAFAENGVGGEGYSMKEMAEYLSETVKKALAVIECYDDGLLRDDGETDFCSLLRKDTAQALEFCKKVENDLQMEPGNINDERWTDAVSQKWEENFYGEGITAAADKLEKIASETLNGGEDYIGSLPHTLYYDVMYPSKRNADYSIDKNIEQTGKEGVRLMGNAVAMRHIIEEQGSELSGEQLAFYTRAAGNLEKDADALLKISGLLKENKETILENADRREAAMDERHVIPYDYGRIPTEALDAAVKELYSDKTFGRPWLEQGKPVELTAYSARKFMEEAFDHTIPDAYIMWHNINHATSVPKELKTVMQRMESLAENYGFEDTSFVKDYEEKIHDYIYHIAEYGLDYKGEGFGGRGSGIYEEGREDILNVSEIYENKYPGIEAEDRSGRDVRNDHDREEELE